MPLDTKSGDIDSTCLISTLNQAFADLNEAFFDGSLPPPLIMVSRSGTRKKGVTLGCFRENPWAVDGEPVHEISIAPANFSGGASKDILSTLLHEMAHLWDFVDFGVRGANGRKKIPAGGHGPDWADKMEAMGLKPSSTGRPGGRRTGRSMSHYIVEGGEFEKWYESWKPDDVGEIDRYETREVLRVPGAVPPPDGGPPGAAPDGMEKGGNAVDGAGGESDAEPEEAEAAVWPGEEESRDRNAVKHACPECGASARPAKDVGLICGNCYDGKGIVSRMVPAPPAGCLRD